MPSSNSSFRNSPSFWYQLYGLAPTKRPFRYPLLIAICMAMPALIGALLGDFQHGLMATMGGTIVMYLIPTSLPKRMLTLSTAAIGFAFCFGLGLLGSVHPAVSALTLAVTATLVSLFTGYFRVAPPGNFFFIMVASIATVIPFEPAAIPERLGLLMLGSMSSLLLAFVYALMFKGEEPDQLVEPIVGAQLHKLVANSIVMGMFVGGGFWFAHLIGMHNPYWVPISCAAIMQGANMRMVWLRKIHRISGTAVGMCLAWVLFQYLEGPWALSAAIVVLSFCIETLIVRNYGYAVVFITPLTVIFAGVASHGLQTDELVFTRLLDISLGSLIGAIGGLCSHWLAPKLIAFWSARRI
ncbi:FUSC family protein [Oceanobacter mangrovi]|uniref:FUSC family protein n=1 Tax=Oceanobacter mangrovi TaxID=2862510 RepID=UPI001C8EA948|nr:FUSC family protein [Oceanobacter mangrovi]